MDILPKIPPKDIMRRYGTFNKMSKIYHQQFTEQTFQTVKEAKDFFLSKKGQELFRYCCDTKFKLVNENKSLHWTVNFGEPKDQRPENKWADIFRDKKAEMVASNDFFVNNPKIDHEAEHLF